MSLPRELARKALHVSTAVVPVAYAAGMDALALRATLGVLAFVALVVETLRRQSASGAAMFTRATGTLLRTHEREGAWAGATWLLVAFLAAALVFPRDVAIAAMLAVSLGDAAAAVVGRWWSERRAPLAHVADAKTWAGTVACALVTALAAVGIARLAPWEAALAGVLAAAAERPRWRFDDNVRVAAAVGIGILLCRLAFS